MFGNVTKDASPEVIENARQMWAIAQDASRPTHERVVAFGMAHTMMLASSDVDLFEKAGIPGDVMARYSLTLILEKMASGFAGGGMLECFEMRCDAVSKGLDLCGLSDLEVSGDKD